MEPCPLDGQVALVTGASHGIGAAIARSLDAAGARVALVARDGAALQKVADTCTQHPEIVIADLSLPDTPTDVAREVERRCGRVDILVNNAAIAARLEIQKTTREAIDSMFAVNVRAALLLTSALVPAMAERGSGIIINLTSVSGLVGTPRRAAYAATKGAMDAATRSLAIELGPMGIRVNAIAPGVVDTDLWAKNKTIPGVIEEVELQTPLRRWALPDDIADVVVFLASDAARFVTGETISVDGGMTKTFNLFSGSV